MLQVVFECHKVYWWNKETNETTALGAPKPTSVAPQDANAAAPAGGGGFMGAMAQGMASGVGFSMASRMMDSVIR